MLIMKITPVLLVLVVFTPLIKGQSKEACNEKCYEKLSRYYDEIRQNVIDTLLKLLDSSEPASTVEDENMDRLKEKIKEIIAAGEKLSKYSLNDTRNGLNACLHLDDELQKAKANQKILNELTLPDKALKCQQIDNTVNNIAKLFNIIVTKLSYDRKFNGRFTLDQETEEILSLLDNELNIIGLTTSSILNEYSLKNLRDFKDYLIAKQNDLAALRITFEELKSEIITLETSLLQLKEDENLLQMLSDRLKNEPCEGPPRNPEI